MFEEAGVDLSHPMVTSCGSGMTAGVVTLAAYILRAEAPIYDVSMLLWQLVFDMPAAFVAQNEILKSL